MKKIITTLLTVSIGLISYSQFQMAANINASGSAFYPGDDDSWEVLFKFNNIFYFEANDGVHGVELWKYDGSSATIVGDINPGSGSSHPQDFVEYQGDLYFNANDGVHGAELWKYDGTTLSMVQDINVGIDESEPYAFYEYNGELYFAADDGINGRELWKLDGTSVTMVQDINIGMASSSPRGFVSFMGDLYFSTLSQGLYKLSTNGQVTQVYSSNSTLMWLTVIGSNLYCTNHNSILKHNGTSTVIITSFTNSNPNAHGLFGYNNELYFVADDGSHGSELWKCTGNSSSMIHDLNTGSNSSEINCETFVEYMGELYFSANDGVHGHELFKYDGNNIILVEDINSGIDGSYPGLMVGIIEYDGSLYFNAYGTNVGNEVYKYNGTQVSLVQDINSGSGSSAPYDFRELNGQLYFIAEDGVNGVELWGGSSVTGINEGNNPIQIANLYPNPTKENTTIEIKSKVSSIVEVNVFDIKGQLKLSFKESLSIGENQIKLELGELTNGLYLITTKDELGNQSQLKLFKD